MRDVLIEEIGSVKELFYQVESIGVNPAEIEELKEDYPCWIVRLFNLDPHQTAMIKNAASADPELFVISSRIHHEVNGYSHLPQVLIGGNVHHLNKLADVLKQPPIGMNDLGLRIKAALTNYLLPNSAPLEIRGHLYDWSRAYVMGIINITPDSFSADGLYHQGNYVDLALAQAERMIEDGADFLDIGAESTRPGFASLEPDEEEKRLLPVLKELVRSVKVPISVDTSKPVVAEKALNIGADILNDIWGLQAPHDPAGRMAKIAASASVPVIVMHNKPNTEYAHLIKEMVEWLARSVDLAEKAGISPNRVILDPGIGFGKTYHQNLVVMKNLCQLRILGKPLLLGTSRKSVIGLTLDLPTDQRVEGTIATVVWGMMQGANIMRVHDVRAVARAVKMGEAIRGI